MTRKEKEDTWTFADKYCEASIIHFFTLCFPFWQVLFLYPDMATGLRGEWNGEKIIRPKVVELVAERCREGLKEVSTRGGEEEWGKDGSMDPQESKQVYV